MDNKDGSAYVGGAAPAGTGLLKDPEDFQGQTSGRPTPPRNPEQADHLNLGGETRKVPLNEEERQERQKRWEARRDAEARQAQGRNRRHAPQSFTDLMNQLFGEEPEPIDDSLFGWVTMIRNKAAEETNKNTVILRLASDIMVDIEADAPARQVIKKIDELRSLCGQRQS